MRRAIGILLGVIATIFGVAGAGWFSLAGLGWSGGFFQRIYWDESESGIGVSFGIVGMLVWLALLGASIAVLRDRKLPRSRAARATSVIVASVSVALVVVACALALGWPEPPNEFPAPDWNRA